MSTKKIQIIGNIATKDDVASLRTDIGELEVVVDGKANKSTTLYGYGITDAYTKTDGEALAERVSNAESGIATLNGSNDGSVRKQISDAIANANLDQYAQKSALDELSTVVAEKSDTSHDHDSTYDIKGAADTALGSANSYTNTNISTHNTSVAAHSDIRGLIAELATKLNNFLDVDDATTDQLSEVLTLINNNKGTLESITTSKINISDIVDNLTTNNSSKVLSAAQGVAIKTLIDELQIVVDGKADTTAIPTKTSQLTNDSGFKTTDNNTTYDLAASASSTNGNVKLNLTAGGSGSGTDSVSIKGSGATTVTTDSSGVITISSTDNDTKYSHPTYTAKSSGLYKVTVDGTGHISATTAVTKADITALGVPAQDTVYTHPSAHAASMITGLATVATSGKYSDLSGLPTIPTVNNATLTIQKNGTNVATFTANSANNATANITVPTKVSELTNDSGFKTTDNNTTYTLTKSGSTITLTGSDGKTSSVTDADTNTVYTHPTSSGNKHIPSGGSSGQILRWSADGTAAWGADNNTTYGVVSTTAAGLAPKRDGSTSKFLRADGTWAVPPDNNTVYTHPGSHPASMITGLATVATSGSYNDLTNKPTIPAAYSHPSSHPASMITGLATVATSGSYNDLSDKPTGVVSHTQSASTITSGTFAGHVSAPLSDYMTYDTPYVRNAVLFDGTYGDVPYAGMHYQDGDFALVYE